MFWLVVRIVLLAVFRVVDDDAGFVNREPKVVTGAKDPEEAARMALGVDLVRNGAPGYLRAQVYFCPELGQATSMVCLYSRASGESGKHE